MPFWDAALLSRCKPKPSSFQAAVKLT